MLQSLGLHQAKIEERINELKSQGYTHTHGGKVKEEFLEIKNGYKSARRPDITMKDPEGNIYRENIGKSTKDGRPISREKKALEDLNSRNDGSTIHYTPYDR